MIQDQDYIYFNSTQLLDACIAEAEDNYRKCLVICNSLNFYIYECLNRGIKAFPSIDINMEMSYASREQIVQNMRVKNWYIIWQAFVAIRNGADIMCSLMPIRMIDPKDITNL